MPFSRASKQGTRVVSELPQFEIGDIVAYSAIAARRYPTASRRRGIIADFEGNRDWAIAIVEWRDGTLSRVHIHNLARPGSNARFCSDRLITT